ncbi:Rne/Rng family ribonuclease [Nonomuraea typhae]|uniref:Rne/Rng family ribonuclease n=1 Tax=Nonomuraea typhae TaxID=2603600 RepID=A0ABW7Z7G8_9ACTN
MLENEPNAGANGPDGETTEDQAKTRPRRAARPAGPPPELPEESAPSVLTVPAGPVSPVEEAVAETVAEEKPKRAARSRSTATATRRRTKKAEEEAEAEAEVTPPAEDKPLRKRVSRRAAGPPPEIDDLPASTAAAAGSAPGPAAEEAPAAAGFAGAAEAAEAPAKRTRRTTKAKAAAEDEAEAPAPVKRTRRTRKAAAEPESPVEAAVEAVLTESGVGSGPSEGVAEGLAEAVADEVVRAQAADAVAEVLGEDVLDELPEEEPLDDEPAGEDLDEDDRPNLLADPFGLTARRLEQGDASYQRPAPIFAPLFQAPDPSQAQPATPRRTEPEPVAAEVVEESAAAEPEAEAEVDADIDADIDADGDAESEDESGGRRRRRRRGGRGRGRARERDDAEDAEDEDEESAEEESQEEEASSSRRRRRRRRRGTDETPEPASDDPPNTVVRIRAPRSGRAGAVDTSSDGVQSVRGSTRLEAKKQRRREGRELGRRRPPIITESEFLARRESVDRMMVVRRHGDRTQIAVLEDGILVEHYVNREASQSYVGNVYLGKVQNVLPSMEAAFVDIGKGRNAVLYAGEVNFDTAGLEGQPKRIESALKSGQSVLVQVTKDPIGHKGARLTSQISLPGRYLVYVPDGSMTGISRKLPDKERARLKSILKKVMPENAGVIVRTAAEGASEDELARDVARLSAQWENIQKKAKSASPPELLSAEPDLTVRVVRDVFNEDFTHLVVQGEEAWETVDEYVKYVAPHLADRMTRWEEAADVFESYRIDEQLGKALERKVWLPSGGSLVIDRTEAMTVVDVNTGKFTGQGGNLEETVTRNNLEAAEEIVRQLRLRDIGGIIVIDFIDMVLESNRDLVLRRLLECLARDRTKHQVAEVTSLGLVQMTRKRVGQGLLEAFSTPCDCCNGRGLIVSTEPVDGKPEPRGTQGKMAIEKAVADKVSAASGSPNRDTVTGALDDVPAEDDQANQTSGRGRRRSRRAKSAE